jgi:tRNA-specific 2-thiouridylase
VPLFVIAKDHGRNQLTVGPRQALGNSEFDADRVNWIDDGGPDGPITCLIRVRYKAREIEGSVSPRPGNRVHVSLSEALPDITPGQAAVFYDGESCLGGGTILP